MAVTVTGVVDVAEGIIKFGKRIGDKAEKAVKLVCLEIYQMSQNLVPREDGVLASTGHVETEPISGGGLQTKGFIMYHTDYALEVHENLNLRHGQTYNVHYAQQIERGETNPWSGKIFKERQPQEQAEFLREPAYANIDMFFGMIRHTMKN